MTRDAFLALVRDYNEGKLTPEEMARIVFHQKEMDRLERRFRMREYEDKQEAIYEG